MIHILESLKFVQGATSESRLDPRLSHFLIKNGYVFGFNGMMQLSSPIDVDPEYTLAPRAKHLIHTLEQCSEDVVMSLTDTGNLRFVSKNFSAVVPTNPPDEMAIEIPPQGRNFVSSPNLLEVFRTMKPFISDDASRTWSTGILIGGGYAYATNNIVVAKMPTGLKTELWFNLPLHVVDEMLRVNENPNGFSIFENGTKITVYYPGHRLITSVLGSMEWPNLNNILDKLEYEGYNYVSAVLHGVDKVVHFCDDEGCVYVSPECVHTALDTKSEGAVVQTSTGAADTTRYSVAMLNKLRGEGNRIDLKPYPGPAPFWNHETGLKGAIVGAQI